MIGVCLSVMKITKDNFVRKLCDTNYVFDVKYWRSGPPYKYRMTQNFDVVISFLNNRYQIKRRLDYSLLWNR